MRSNCAALALGGLTPSAGLAASVFAIARPAGVAVRAMVRPRPGDFTYDDRELALAVAEARALLASGVDGLIFGAVRDERLDAGAIRDWRQALGVPTGLTLHRAIDTVGDPVAAIDDAVALGFDQVLSSGGAPTAPGGAETLAAMVHRAGGRCRVVAGSGVRPDNVVALVKATGVQAIHSSARGIATRAAAADPMSFGRADPPADTAVVRALRAALDNSISTGTGAERNDG